MIRRTQRLSLTQTVPPTVWPVTLEEVKAHCRIDEGHEDALLESLIQAATLHVEHLTGRQIMAASWRLTLDRFPIGCLNDPSSPAIEGNDILLPRPRLLSVTSITYDDVNGAEQTMASGDYRVQTDDTPGRIALAYNEEWPDTRAHAGAVRVVYVAGYSASADPLVARAAVPQNVKQAILLLVGHWFEHREAVVLNATPQALEFTVDALLSPVTCMEIW